MDVKNEIKAEDSADASSEMSDSTLGDSSSAAAAHTSGNDDGNMGELTSLIQGVLQQTQDRFQHMSDQIIRRIDDMTKRIDDLEKNIGDLMTQNQVDQPPSA